MLWPIGVCVRATRDLDAGERLEQRDTGALGVDVDGGMHQTLLRSFLRSLSAREVDVFRPLGNPRQDSHSIRLHFDEPEHRKPLLRSVNAGISAYVDPVGRVVEQTQTTDSDADGYQGAEGFAVDVPMMPTDHRTVFGATGSLFGWLCIAGLAGVWVMSRYRRPAGVLR